MTARPRRSRKAEQDDTGRRDPLVSLHEWFATIDPRWWTMSVNFQAAKPQSITVGRNRWRVVFTVYGVRWGFTRASRIRYEATISVWPRNVTPQDQARLTRAGWYAKMTAQFRRLGYRGEWHKNPGGKCGLFSKRLHDLDAVQAEVARLDAVHFSTAGRRTKR